MGAVSLDVEFSKHRSQLTPQQKQFLLSFIKSFVQEEEKLNIEKYNQELKEAEAEFDAGNYITP